MFIVDDVVVVVVVVVVIVVVVVVCIPIVVTHLVLPARLVRATTLVLGWFGSRTRLRWFGKYTTYSLHCGLWFGLLHVAALFVTALSHSVSALTTFVPPAAVTAISCNVI